MFAEDSLIGKYGLISFVTTSEMMVSGTVAYVARRATLFCFTEAKRINFRVTANKLTLNQLSSKYYLMNLFTNFYSYIYHIIIM